MSEPLRKQRCGRPTKCDKVKIVPEHLIKDDGELQELCAHLSEEEEAKCLPNGRIAIECFICGQKMTKIYKLRCHLQSHTKPESYDGKVLESAPIYDILNPYRRNIEWSVIRDFLINEIKGNRCSQLYGMLSEAGVELHHSDSETLSEGDETDVDATAKQIPRNTYKCDLCQIIFDRRYKALFHQRTSHAQGEDLPLRCDVCGSRFMGVQLLIHHLKTQCESDEHPINLVERFQSYLVQMNLEHFQGLAQARRELKIHRLTTAEKVYACDVCQKTFLRSEHLTRHKSVHLPDKLKMECPVCFKKFNRKDNLRSHMKVHMNEAERDTSANQSILCQYCGLCFSSKSNYVVHMRRRHTGEKPYTCEVCGKGFPKSTDLNSHKITHTGERNFKCNICSKTFARAAVLTKHMRVHSGPYHCTYCNQSFQQPNALANHLRFHVNGEAFKCNECPSCFNTKEQLELHWKSARHEEKQNTSEVSNEEGRRPTIVVPNSEPQGIIDDGNAHALATPIPTQDS